jgi:hypothetical protein
VTGELVDPAGDLEPERGRQRGLRVRAADGELLAVRDREDIEPFEQADQLGLDEIEHVAHLERLTGVLDVLRRRAVVDELRGVAADDLLECAQQRHERVAALLDAGADRREIEALDARRGRDDVRGFVRDHLHLGLRHRERDLDVEPPLQPTDVTEDSPAVRGRITALVKRRIDHVTAFVTALSRRDVVVVVRCNHQVACSSVLRITRPGRAPVSWPSRMTCTPWMNVPTIPFARAISRRPPRAGRRRTPAVRSRSSWVRHDIRVMAGLEQSATRDLEPCRMRRRLRIACSARAPALDAPSRRARRSDTGIADLVDVCTGVRDAEHEARLLQQRPDDIAIEVRALELVERAQIVLERQVEECVEVLLVLGLGDHPDRAAVVLRREIGPDRAGNPDALPRDLADVACCSAFAAARNSALPYSARCSS